MTTATERRSNIAAGSVWMVAISLLLFFLPLLNGLIGGIVGGLRAGDPKRALAAAVLPALVVSLGLWLLVAAFAAPVVGFMRGAAPGAVVLLAIIGLFVGAALGGWIAQSRHRPAGRPTAPVH